MNPQDEPDKESPSLSLPEDFVTLTRFQTSSEAQPLRIALEENGIPVFLADDNTVTVNWLWGPALGYVKVQVPKSQAAAALEIAKQHVPARTEAEENKEIEKPVKCLACGTEVPEDSDTCPKCGWTFNTPEEKDEDGPEARS